MTVARAGSRCCIPDAEGYILDTVGMSGCIYGCAAVAGTMASDTVVTLVGMERMFAECRRNGMTAAAGRYRWCGRGSAGLCGSGTFTGAVHCRDNIIVGSAGNKTALGVGTGCIGNLGAGFRHARGGGIIDVVRGGT